MVAAVAFVFVVGHVSGFDGADVGDWVVAVVGEEIGEGETVAVSVGAAFAPGERVAEGEDTEGDALGDGVFAPVGSVCVCGCWGRLRWDGVLRVLGSDLLQMRVKYTRDRRKEVFRYRKKAIGVSIFYGVERIEWTAQQSCMGVI